MCRVGNHQTRLPRATSSLALNASRDGASTPSLGNLFQCVITLTVKNFFLLSNLNLPCLSLKPFLLDLEGHNEVSSKPSLLQAKQAQFSQSFLIGEVLQPSGHLSGLPLDTFQELCIFVLLGAPGLDAVLQRGPQKSQIEGDDHLPLPAGHPLFNAAQNTIGLLGLKHTLLAHFQLLVHQDPQVLLCRAALKEFFSQSIVISGIATTQVQHLGLVKPH